MTGRKVRVTYKPPVEERHGITLGRVFEVARMCDEHERPYLCVVGDTGEEVGLLWREFEFIEEEE